MSSSAAPTSRDPEHAASTFLHGVAAIILLIAAASPLSAQSYFFGQATFPAGNTPSAIVLADLNHDGIPDTIVANAQDDTISALLGNPDGTFGAQTTFATGHTPISVVTGDFNGDGNMDVAVLNANCIPSRLGEVCYGGWISLLLGKGDGTFLPAVNYAVGSAGGRYATLLAADLNGDGQLDLVATNGADRTVSVLLNNGAGGFQDQVVYSVPNGAQSIAIADFNGDHKLDIAVTGSTMSVLLGNGNGTFQPPVVSGGLGGSIAVADFNHDGKLDAVTTPSQVYGGGYLTVLLGNGDGTFTPIATSTVAANVVYTTDLNGDGKADLVLLEGSFGNGFGFTVELGNGDGTFQAGVTYGAGASPSAAAIADINGDGRLDVLTANASGKNVSAALGYGNGTFVTFADYQSAQYAILSADFNGDQKPDLAAVTNNNVEVMLNNGNGTFAFPKQTALTHSTNSLIAGDFNHDGRQDVATVFANCNNGCQPGTAAVLLGNGDGTFQPEQLATVGLNPVALASGDFNRNDRLDLVVANENANTISVLLGNGDGTFQTHVDYITTASPHFVAVADLNGDGNPDIVVLDNGFSIFFGNGDGTFRTRVDNTTVGGSQVIIADFNGDGIPDLCFEYNGLTVLLGNGDGTFQAPLYSAASGTPFAAADFNGDDKLDIVSVPYGSPLYLELGNGNGTFALQGSYRVSDGPTYYMAVADFNGDGVPDIATNGQSNSVSVQLSVPFKAVSPAAVNFGSQGVSTASLPQVVTITNSSNVKINITSIVTAAPFSQTNDCTAALEPGAYCTASIVFTPSATGLDSGVLTIVDSTFNSPTHVALSGTGVSGPFLMLIPASVQFQPINVGSSSNPMSVQLKNSGNANLTISSLGIGGANGSDYTQTNNCPGSLPVGQSCTANVTFTPTAGGVRAANLAITDNASGSPQTVPLSGIGLALENTLTVVIHGSGGQVNSRDGFIHCPEVCMHVYPAGAQVTLTTTVDEYWRFYDWDGNCSGGSCVLNMTQNMTAIATFQYTYPGLEFVPMTPCRVADTRWPVGQWGGPALQGGTARTYEMVGGTCYLPQNAIAFSLNLTVIPHGYLGYLTVWPGSQNQPLVSTMNSLDGRIKANAAIVPAGNDSNSIQVYASDTTDFVMDIDGYFQDGGAELGFYPLPPCRVVDTRGANGDLGGPFLTGGTERDFPLLESSCIPQGVTPQAYSLNVTAVPHTAGQPLSYLTVWQQGQAKPLASTLNNPTATIVANAALVVAGQSGAIATYPSDDTDLVVDINGYFANYQQGALLFYPLYPCRVLDTRQGAGAFSGQLSPPVDVIDNPCGANSTAQAYIFNATVVPSPSLSYLTLWPDGQNRPVVSTLNAADGWITSNMAIVPTTNGSIDAYAAGMTQLILDIPGYFAP